jgi:hypothetical protein
VEFDVPGLSVFQVVTKSSAGAAKAVCPTRQVIKANDTKATANLVLQIPEEGIIFTEDIRFITDPPESLFISIPLTKGKVLTQII